MKDMHKNLRLALEYSNQHEYDEGLEYSLCAVIVRGGSVLSVGYNKRSTNSFVEHFVGQLRTKRDFCESTHAEMNAVLKARSKTDLAGSKIFVIRRKANGELALARPCVICQHILYNYGIRRAIYSIDTRTYGVMKIGNPANLPDENYEDVVSTG